MARRREMRAISQKPLRKFWEKHADAEEPLRAWYKVVKKAHWKNFAEVRSVYNSVSLAGNCYVFNIRGNHYRLIANISHDWTVLLVCTVLTHMDYDREKWKDACQCNA